MKKEKVIEWGNIYLGIIKGALQRSSNDQVGCRKSKSRTWNERKGYKNLLLWEGRILIEKRPLLTSTQII